MLTQGSMLPDGVFSAPQGGRVCAVLQGGEGMSSHWFEKERTYGMNDSVIDIQNMRKSILNCTMNIRVEDDVDRLFVKSLCGFMGVLSDFEMLYLGRRFQLMDEETMAANLDLAKERIASMFSDPRAVDSVMDSLSVISRYLAKKEVEDGSGQG